MAGVSTEGAAEFNNKKVVYLLVDNAMKWLGVTQLIITAQESTILSTILKSVWIMLCVCRFRCALRTKGKHA